MTDKLTTIATAPYNDTYKTCECGAIFSGGYCSNCVDRLTHSADRLLIIFGVGKEEILKIMEEENVTILEALKLSGHEFEVKILNEPTD